MVELGIAISVSIRFGRLFSHALHVLGLNLKALHDLLRVISLNGTCLSVRP